MRGGHWAHPAAPGPPLPPAVFAALLAALLVLGASWPYLAEVYRRRGPGPRLVSWFIFAEVTAVGAVQAFRDGQYPSAVLTAASALACVAVIVLGRRNPDRTPLTPRQLAAERACLAAGQAGVVLLAVSVPWPALFPLWAAVAVAVGTDAAAYAPTMANGWRGGEPWKPFALWTAAAAVTVAVADFGAPLALIYPVYLLAANGAMTGIALARGAG